MERSLASVIVEARRALGLTQAELAGRAGISASYLSRIEGAAWERGGPWPTDSVLRALARALGLSSTELVAMQRTTRSRIAGPRPPGHPATKNGRLPYAVTVGHEEVDGAARDLVRRNPPRGTLRSLQVGHRRSPPSYEEALQSAPAADPGTILRQVCASTVEDPARGGSPGHGNVQTRFISSDRLVLDVLIGDHEVLLAVPDRRGPPYLRAGVVVDDPDFVAAVREWFDDSVWDPAQGDMGAAVPPRSRPPPAAGSRPTTSNPAPSDSPACLRRRDSRR